MGAVLAAVSPAVVVPRMVKLMDEGYGVKEGIPQLILAGASVDDVYVIVLFSTFVGMMQGEGASVLKFVNIPISIFLGIAIGLVLGVLLAHYFKKVHIRDTSKLLIILSISFLLVVLEDKLTTAITFSSLIAIMFIGVGLQKKREVVAKRLSAKYGKLWVAAEVFLFVLVGANSKYIIPWKSRSEGSPCNCWCTCIQNAWCICMPVRNKPETKRAVICYAGVYPKSNRSGCNWRNTAGIRFRLRRYGAYCGGSCDCDHSTTWGICH